MFQYSKYSDSGAEREDTESIFVLQENVDLIQSNTIKKKKNHQDNHRFDSSDLVFRFRQNSFKNLVRFVRNFQR